MIWHHSIVDMRYQLDLMHVACGEITCAMPLQEFHFWVSISVNKRRRIGLKSSQFAAIRRQCWQGIGRVGYYTVTTICHYSPLASLCQVPEQERAWPAWRPAFNSLAFQSHSWPRGVSGKSGSMQHLAALCIMLCWSSCNDTITIIIFYISLYILINFIYWWDVVVAKDIQLENGRTTLWIHKSFLLSVAAWAVPILLLLRLEDICQCSFLWKTSCVWFLRLQNISNMRIAGFLNRSMTKRTHT